MGKKIVLMICGLFLLAGCAVLTPEPTAMVQASETPRPPTVTVAKPKEPTTVMPTETPTPAPTEPVAVDWSVDAVELVGWSTGIASVRWLDNHTILGEVGIYDFYFDIHSENLLRVTERPPYDYFPWLAGIPISYSPERTYALTCQETSTNLYRLADMQMIAYSDLQADCYADFAGLLVSWADDESAVAFNVDRKLYVWEFEQADPKLVGDSTCVHSDWSPNGSKILCQGLHSYYIAYRDGSPALDVPVNVGPGDIARLWWETEEILSQRYFGMVEDLVFFYNAETGRELTGYEMFYVPENVQPHLKSPNGRWIVLDKAFGREGDYTLFDLQTQQEYVLGSAPEIFYFLGWSDSGRFYFARQPDFDADTWEDGEYGLLALNPVTRTSEMIIPGAMYVAWDAQQQHVLSIAWHRNDNGNIYTDAALSDIRGNILTEPVIVARQVLEFSWELPHHEGWQGKQAAGYPDAWELSNSGDKAVFADMDGNIKVIGVAGYHVVLLENATIDKWPYMPEFLWSPDDKHILVTFNQRAWAVEVPD
ncbi:MAG: hypothetical protein JXB38_17945 [Anaerolineales bacterium]|nr:hypothetical protein [Anaerolineales bacterium]